MEKEWQLVAEDQWIYGIKIRGLVRRPKAEVYFDGEAKDYGWRWLVYDVPEDPDKMRRIVDRGTAMNLYSAVASAEEVLGLVWDWFGTNNDLRLL